MWWYGRRRPTPPPRVSDRFSLGALELRDGDLVEVQVGRTNVVGRFRGFDERLYAFILEEGNSKSVVVIPYKAIRLLRKPGVKPRRRSRTTGSNGQQQPPQK